MRFRIDEVSDDDEGAVASAAWICDETRSVARCDLISSVGRFLDEECVFVRERAGDGAEKVRASDGYMMRWEQIDAALRSIAGRRAALDAEEARWLREAEAMQLWRRLGMVSMLDYLERVLGYGPHAAKERMRVANALEDL